MSEIEEASECRDALLNPYRVLQDQLNCRVKGESVKPCTLHCPKVRGLFADIVIPDWRIPQGIIGEDTADVKEMCIKERDLWLDK